MATHSRSRRTSRDKSRLRYPDDDFPIALVIGGLGVAGLAYLVLKKKPAPALGPAPAPVNAPPVMVPPPSANLNAADVQRRYKEIQEQATFDTRAFQGQESLLTQLIADLNATGDARGARDVQAILEAVRRL